MICNLIIVIVIVIIIIKYIQNHDFESLTEFNELFKDKIMCGPRFVWMEVFQIFNKFAKISPCTTLMT